jgi:hypothetical protein
VTHPPEGQIQQWPSSWPPPNLVAELIAKLISDEVKKWSRVILAANIKPQ